MWEEEEGGREKEEGERKKEERGRKRYRKKDEEEEYDPRDIDQDKQSAEGRRS